MRVGEVLDTVGLGRSALYEAIRAGRFPKPIRLTERANAWPASEVYAWLADRIAERDRKRGSNPASYRQAEREGR